MFKKCRVLYIVKNKSIGQDKIINDLKSFNLLSLFFPSEINSNRSNTRDLEVFLSTLPVNTAFCIYDSEYNQNTHKNVFFIALPFFSSHVNFPIKVGEKVWLYEYEEDINFNNYKINGYYLGRVHGTRETEDTSYCFSDREESIFSINNLELDDLDIKTFGQGINSALTLKDKLDFNSNTVKEISFYPESAVLKGAIRKNIFSSQIKEYNLKPNYSIENHHSDTVLKGTHNSVLRLTKSNLSSGNYKSYADEDSNHGGRIEIIAGEKERIKSSYEDIAFLKKNDATVSQDYSVIRSYDNCPPSIHNGMFWEKIKSSRLFVSSNETTERLSNEINSSKSYGNQDKINNDSSKIIVAEHSHEDFIIRQTFLKNTQDDISKDEIVAPKILNFLDDNSPYSEFIFSSSFNNVFNSKTNFAEYGTNTLPNITMMSNNITLFSFRDANNPGDISLINSNSISGISSKISLTKSGSILIDSDKIVLGNSSKQSKTSTLYLGYDRNNMQSLVKGDSLKMILLELLDTQRETMTVTKNLAEELQENLDIHYNSINSKLSLLTKEFNIGQDPGLARSYDVILNEKIKVLTSLLGAVPVAGPALASILPMIISDLFSNISINIAENFQDKLEQIFNESIQDLDKVNNKIQNTFLHRNEKLSIRLESLEKNINTILSKFAKTSWIL